MLKFKRVIFVLFIFITIIYYFINSNILSNKSKESKIKKDLKSALRCKKMSNVSDESYNLSKSLDCYFKLARHGNSEAQYYRGLMYQLIDKRKEANEWYRKAADQGHVKAQFHMGFLYFLGQEVELNYLQAKEWFLKAAKQGHSGAQYKLGEIYRDGKGVPISFSIAYKWFNLSASQDNSSKEYRDKLALEMTSEQIAVGQILSREFYEKYLDNN